MANKKTKSTLSPKQELLNSDEFKKFLEETEANTVFEPSVITKIAKDCSILMDNKQPPEPNVTTTGKKTRALEKPANKKTIGNIKTKRQQNARTAKKFQITLPLIKDSSTRGNCKIKKSKDIKTDGNSESTDYGKISIKEQDNDDILSCKTQNLNLPNNDIGDVSILVNTPLSNNNVDIHHNNNESLSGQFIDQGEKTTKLLTSATRHTKVKNKAKPITIVKTRRVETKNNMTEQENILDGKTNNSYMIIKIPLPASIIKNRTESLEYAKDQVNTAELKDSKDMADLAPADNINIMKNESELTFCTNAENMICSNEPSIKPLFVQDVFADKPPVEISNTDNALIAIEGNIGQEQCVISIDEGNSNISGVVDVFPHEQKSRETSLTGDNEPFINIDAIKNTSPEEEHILYARSSSQAAQNVKALKKELRTRKKHNIYSYKKPVISIPHVIKPEDKTLEIQLLENDIPLVDSLPEDIVQCNSTASNTNSHESSKDTAEQNHASIITPQLVNTAFDIKYPDENDVIGYNSPSNCELIALSNHQLYNGTLCENDNINNISPDNSNHMVNDINYNDHNIVFSTVKHDFDKPFIEYESHIRAIQKLGNLITKKTFANTLKCTLDCPGLHKKMLPEENSLKEVISENDTADNSISNVQPRLLLAGSGTQDAINIQNIDKNIDLICDENQKPLSSTILVAEYTNSIIDTTINNNLSQQLFIDENNDVAKLNTSFYLLQNALHNNDIVEPPEWHSNSNMETKKVVRKSRKKTSPVVKKTKQEDICSDESSDGFSSYYNHQFFNDKADSEITEKISFSYEAELTSDKSSETSYDSPLEFEDVLSSISSNESSSSFEFPTETHQDLINWQRYLPIVKFLLENSPVDDIKNPVESYKRNVFKNKKYIDPALFTDTRYLYFLKKVCVLGKKDAVMYVKDQTKHLLDRADKSKAMAGVPCEYFYTSLKNGVKINMCEKNNSDDIAGENSGLFVLKKTAIVLQKITRLNDVEIPFFVEVDFEYLVIKHGDNLESIAEESGINIKDVIKIYYLKYHNVQLEIAGPLLDKYVQEEWSNNDRKIFEENFSKHDTKFNKYMMNKSEEDLRIYYRFYLKNHIPVNWSNTERTTFAHLFRIYKKDWISLQNSFTLKSVQDLKVYYCSYFKKLDEDERTRELSLVSIELPSISHKKRGRKPYALTKPEEDDNTQNDN